MEVGANEIMVGQIHLLDDLCEITGSEVIMSACLVITEGKDVVPG